MKGSCLALEMFPLGIVTDVLSDTMTTTQLWDDYGIDDKLAVGHLICF